VFLLGRLASNGSRTSMQDVHCCGKGTFNWFLWNLVYKVWLPTFGDSQMKDWLWS